MNQRSPVQSYFNNSLAVRQEIQRFESVHPSIYAIYDLIDAVADPLIQQQIREHVVCIEDSFVNSQEWTLSRSVPDLKLGILGSVLSGKSALVHRYLTGSYMQEESPEGGRFKKEVMIDNQSYLLLIRDEGGAPEMQFTQWVDAVILVFSLENEASFQSIYQYYLQMTHFRNTAEIPLILVGTQDAISESNPRIIDEALARKLANDLKRCSYYETCATYGLNVERVFQDACSRIVQFRYPSIPSVLPSVPSTSNHSQRPYYVAQTPKPYDTHSSSSQSTSSSRGIIATRSDSSIGVAQVPPTSKYIGKEKGSQPEKEKSDKKKDKHKHESPADEDEIDYPHSTPLSSRKSMKQSSAVCKSNSFNGITAIRQFIQSHTTPILRRKNSKILKHSFLDPKTKSMAVEDKKQDEDKLGYRHVIPVKQGYLFKKSHGLNKDWKKKYVTLLDDGRLIYHRSLRDYMGEAHAQEIPLGRVTVKVPGMRPRGSRSANAHQESANNTNVAMEMNSLSIGDSDTFEFHIVSLYNKQWQFQAENTNERDEWVAAIELQILASLQGNKSTGKKQSSTDAAGILAIKNTRGNNQCADCGASAPEWASLNLGTLICIECSGIHRNLGTHLSRVRSLGLDEWPLDLIHVMTSIGNTIANSVWEFNLNGRQKPSFTLPREEKEKWIRAKYDSKEFLPPLPYVDIPLNQQLIDALVREDIRNIVLILGHSHAEDITAPYSHDDGRTALHIAAALGNVVFVQLLLWQNADVQVMDHEGRNALWYATTSGSQECINLLMNSGCSEHPTLQR